jgi:hypothetical protein
MKNFLVIFCAVVFATACKTNDKKAAEGSSTESKATLPATAGLLDTTNFTSIEWVDNITQDMGKVKEGAVVEVTYRFKNVGNKSLVIEDVVAGCGCTVPEKPEKAFAPGEEGVIRAKFDSKGRIGTNNKYVTVTSNTSPNRQQTLQFNVEVTK